MLGNLSPLGSSEGRGEGCEYYPSLHEGLPALPNGACWALNEPFLSSGCFRRKRSSSEKCICHEGMSGFDAYHGEEITLDVNTSIHMHSRRYFSLLLSTVLTRQSIMFMN